MAVQALYYSDKDGYDKAIQSPERFMFADPKAAKERDKVLDLAGELMSFIQKQVPEVDEDTAEKIGIALAENSDRLKQALKNPSALNEPDKSDQ